MRRCNIRNVDLFKGSCSRSEHEIDAMRWWKERSMDTKESFGWKVEEGSGSRGRGLFATRCYEPGETVASVPMDTSVGCSTVGSDEMHWSLDLAIQLMERIDGPGGSNQDFCTWTTWLPSANANPVQFAFTEQEIEDLQTREAVKDAVDRKKEIEEILESDRGIMAINRWGMEAINWAQSMAHSRSFAIGGEYWMLPLIDLCNHDFQPNAIVHNIRNPHACQGLDALEEVAPIESIAIAPDRFALIAGDSGIKAGDEILINYGNKSNEEFLLSYGFVPDTNPHDALVLFKDVAEMARFIEEHGAGIWGDGEGLNVAVHKLDKELDSTFDAMMLYWDKIDDRVVDAAKFLSKLSGKYVDATALIVARCNWLLQSYGTSLEDDHLLLQNVLPTENRTLALKYRISKKTLLHKTATTL